MKQRNVSLLKKDGDFLRTTIKDIQRTTKLSLSTISKYLNGGNVLEANKKMIDIAVSELDFKVNQFARSLKTNKSNTIGLLIPELNSTFHTVIMADVEDALRQNGYGVIICDSRLNKETEREAVSFLVSKKVDGIITIPFDSEGQHLEIAKADDVPIVLIDRLTTGFEADAVIIDNENASKKALEELIRHGHKDIGIICASDKIYTMKERMSGYEKALKAHGIPIDKRLTAIADMSITGGYNGFKAIMESSHKPTALYLVNYEITLGAIIAMNELGIKIGEDISVIGFDNMELAKVIKPKLTIVMQPINEIANLASELLLKRLSGENKSPEKTIITLETSLEKGDSVINI